MSIMGNKDTVFQPIMNFCGDIFKGRRFTYHLRRNARKPGDKVWNFSAGINQRMKPVGNLNAIIVIDRNLRYAMIFGIPSGGLNIYDGIHWEVEGRLCFGELKVQFY